MRVGALRHTVYRLSLGLRGRCPHCGLGQLFARRFHLNDTCPYCAVRFARARGEMLGAMYLNSMLTLVLALAGFFIAEWLFQPALLVQFVVWVAFCLIFPLLFFRLAYGLWLAISYLTGGVYADPDYEREWINPNPSPLPAPRHDWGGD